MREREEKKAKMEEQKKERKREKRQLERELYILTQKFQLDQAVAWKLHVVCY